MYAEFTASPTLHARQSRSMQMTEGEYPYERPLPPMKTTAKQFLENEIYTRLQHVALLSLLACTLFMLVYKIIFNLPLALLNLPASIDEILTPTMWLFQILPILVLSTIIAAFYAIVGNFVFSIRRANWKPSICFQYNKIISTSNWRIILIRLACFAGFLLINIFVCLACEQQFNTFRDSSLSFLLYFITVFVSCERVWQFYYDNQYLIEINNRSTKEQLEILLRPNIMQRSVYFKIFQSTTSSAAKIFCVFPVFSLFVTIFFTQNIKMGLYNALIPLQQFPYNLYIASILLITLHSIISLNIEIARAFLTERILMPMPESCYNLNQLSLLPICTIIDALNESQISALVAFYAFDALNYIVCKSREKRAILFTINKISNHPQAYELVDERCNRAIGSFGATLSEFCQIIYMALNSQQMTSGGPSNYAQLVSIGPELQSECDTMITNDNIHVIVCSINILKILSVAAKCEDRYGIVLKALHRQVKAILTLRDSIVNFLTASAMVPNKDFLPDWKQEALKSLIKTINSAIEDISHAYGKNFEMIDFDPDTRAKLSTMRII